MTYLRFNFCTLVAFVVLAAQPACHPTSLQLWRPAAKPDDTTIEVERVRGVVYYDGLDADARRHQIDLYLPKGKKDCPVVVLVHGGAWIVGDNRHYGLNASVGEFLASQGIAAALPNYRLSPGVKHPEHVKDVARAVAWVRGHIAEYGGNPDRLFLAGHSAGGHLVSLLATDEQYLKAEGMTHADIKGVISVSGVYRIPSGKLALSLGGDSERGFRLDEVTPLRGGGGAWSNLPALPGVGMNINFFGPAFGNEPEVREQASPINHVRTFLPPFLIITAEKDLPTLTEPAGEFHRALLSKGNESEFLHVKKRNHNSVMFSAVSVDDPVAEAMLRFVRQHGGKERFIPRAGLAAPAAP
jgi:acetyl esterase/lipase